MHSYIVALSYKESSVYPSMPYSLPISHTLSTLVNIVYTHKGIVTVVCL